MITDTEPKYALEGRNLSYQELLEIECARHRLADLTSRDCKHTDFVFTSAKLVFAGNLEERYGNACARDYLMFHVLLSSTSEKPFKHYDFAGDDSVRKFLENAYRQYLGS